MEKTKILIIDQDPANADSFKRVVENILPTSEIDIISDVDNISKIQEKKTFDIIILDSREALALIPKENYKNVVVCSKDYSFVSECIKNAQTKIILRSHDFYERILCFFIDKRLV